VWQPFQTHTQGDEEQQKTIDKEEEMNNNKKCFTKEGKTLRRWRKRIHRIQNNKTELPPPRRKKEISS